MKNLFILLLLSVAIISCNSDDSAQIVNFEIGDEHQGGIIFYIDDTGEHGLIAYTSDIGDAPWGCLDTDPTPPNPDPPSTPIAQNEGIGFGEQNTLAIADFCNEDNIAARLSLNLNANGFDDWYLPSIDELTLIYENKELIGGFPNLNNDPLSGEYFTYSSSSEGVATGDGNGGFYYLNYIVYDFSVTTVIENARKVLTGKDNSVIVRPIRSF